MNSNFLRNIMVWIIFGSLLMYVFNNIDSANVREQISYSQFRQEVLSDRVAKVVYKGDQMTITGERLDGSNLKLITLSLKEMIPLIKQYKITESLLYMKKLSNLLYGRNY